MCVCVFFFLFGFLLFIEMIDIVGACFCNTHLTGSQVANEVRSLGHQLLAKKHASLQEKDGFKELWASYILAVCGTCARVHEAEDSPEHPELAGTEDHPSS